MSTKTLFIFSIVIGIVVVTGVVILLRGSREQPDYVDYVDDSSGLIIRNSAIYVAEQKPGDRVLVSLVRLEKPGFVVIHEDAAGNPGKILGVSSLLPKGETKNLLAVTLYRATKDGETIYAMLYFDNGDGAFDDINDKPVLDSVGGVPMLMVVIVSKDAAEPGIVNP